MIRGLSPCLCCKRAYLGYGSGDPPFVIPECADDLRRALDPQQDPVARIADPTQMEVALLTVGEHGESRAALHIRPVMFDPFQQ